MDYENQANEFLKNTGTTIKIVFFKNDYYFPDDKEKRDIYNIYFNRKSHNAKACFRFGQSLACTAKNEKPRAYDILACVTKSHPGSFEEFISDFGYNQEKLTEYPRIRKLYRDVCAEFAKVNRLWNDVMDELQEIN